MSSSSSERGCYNVKGKCAKDDADEAENDDEKVGGTKPPTSPVAVLAFLRDAIVTELVERS